MINAIFQYKFLQNAFVCSILISIACGIIGTIIIEKKLVMLSGGIAHTSFGGIGLGYLTGIEPILGAFLFAVAAALGIGTISKRSSQSADIATGIFWSAGMALGILFIAFTPGYPPDMSSYLFGDILTVSRLDLMLTLLLDTWVVFLTVAFYHYLRAYLFDEEFSTVLKLKTGTINNLLHVTIALTIVILIRAVGIVLVLALLTAPPAVVKLFCCDLKRIMILSVLISMLACLVGLWLSYAFHIASGASIVLFTALIYLLSYIVKRLLTLQALKKMQNRQTL